MGIVLDSGESRGRRRSRSSFVDKVDIPTSQKEALARFRAKQGFSGSGSPGDPITQADGPVPVETSRSRELAARAAATEAAVAESTPGVVVVQPDSDGGVNILTDVLTATQRTEILERTRAGDPISREELAAKLKRTARERGQVEGVVVDPETGRAIRATPGVLERVEILEIGRRRAMEDKPTPPVSRGTGRTSRLPPPPASLARDIFGTIEEQLEAQRTRTQEFFDSPGVQRIENLASFLTFGGPQSRREERGFAGQTAESVAIGLLGGVLFVGATVAGAAEKGFIAGRILAREGEIDPTEFGRAAQEVEQTAFSFLPGGTPINPEGAATLVFASLFAAPEAAGRISSGRGTSPVTVRGATVRTASGLEVSRTILGIEAGTRSVPLLSITRTGRLPGLLESRSTRAPPSPEIRVGSPRSRFAVRPAELAETIAQPETALGGRALRGILDFTPAETARITSAVRVSRVLQPERGLSVEDVLFRVEALRDAGRASSIIEGVAAEEGGVFFGSATTEQLPLGFRNVVIGDVDVFFPGRSVAQLSERVIPDLVLELRRAGENVRQSPDNLLTIEEATTRAKIVEAKSGIDQASLGEELAPAGFLGIEFADIKAGQTPETVAFGRARAITAGEQLARKGSASLLVNPEVTFPAVPEPFQSGGVFGRVRPSSPRTLKDVAGFIQSGRGIIAIREGRPAPIRLLQRFRTSQAQRALDVFEQSFTAEQQAAIQGKLLELTGRPELVPLRSSLAEPPSQPSPAVPASGASVAADALLSFERLELETTQISSRVPRSPQPAPRSPSPLIALDVSPSLLPLGILDSPSPSPAPGGSPLLSPSPLSPSRSASPSPSRSPSPSLLDSPSPSPSQSPSPSESPSPSILDSPSPSPSRSPSPRTSASPSPSSSPSPALLDTPETTRPLPPLLGRGEGPSFGVQVRRAGEFEFLEDARTAQEAFDVGLEEVRTTPQASFRILRSSGEVADPADFGIELPSDVRRGKREPNVIIELTEFRIDTPGELAGIPGKSQRRGRRAPLGEILL